MVDGGYKIEIAAKLADSHSTGSHARHMLYFTLIFTWTFYSKDIYWLFFLSQEQFEDLRL